MNTLPVVIDDGYAIAVIHSLTICQQLSVMSSKLRSLEIKLYYELQFNTRI